MEELYLTYLNRKHEIIGAGYAYEEVWEHAYDEKLATDSEFANFTSELPYVEPLTPADAFTGGRTELFTLYAEA